MSILAATTFAQLKDDEFGDDGGSNNQPPPTIEPEQIEQTVTQAGDLEQTPVNQPVHAEPDGGEVNLPAGSQVSIDKGNIQASSIDSAKTRTGTQISSCTNAYIGKNGVVRAAHCDVISVGPLRFSDVTNVEVSGNTITFDSAKKSTLL